MIFRDYDLPQPAPSPSSSLPSAQTTEAKPTTSTTLTESKPITSTTESKTKETREIYAEEGRKTDTKISKTQAEKERKKRQKARIAVEHVDIIKDGFWEKRPWILAGRGFKVPIE